MAVSFHAGCASIVDSKREASQTKANTTLVPWVFWDCTDYRKICSMYKRSSSLPLQAWQLGSARWPSLTQWASMYKACSCTLHCTRPNFSRKDCAIRVLRIFLHGSSDYEAKAKGLPMEQRSKGDSQWPFTPYSIPHCPMPNERVLARCAGARSVEQRPGGADQQCLISEQGQEGTRFRIQRPRTRGDSRGFR